MKAAELPQHIAIIMDGNGRWAKKRFLPRVFGHQSALKRIKEILRYASDHHIEALTLYAFSTENWKRPKEEVSFLMNLVLKALSKELKALHTNQVQFRVLGDMTGLPQKVQDILNTAITLTKDNSGIVLNIALNYGGRAEIVRAAQKMAEQAISGISTVDEFTEEVFASFLYTNKLPDVDLMIRTGGEHRISNFLLWQLAYAELYFTDILFPDFGIAALQDALSWFGNRERRYGMISEQLHEKIDPSNTN